MRRNKISLKLMAGFVVTILLLVTAVGALAATAPFTMVGQLEYDSAVYSVNGVEFDLAPAVVCTGGDCAALAGQLVEVKGTYDDIAESYTAEIITVVTSATAEGNLDSFDSSAWVIAGTSYQITPSTVLPGFGSVDDTVKVTFTVDTVSGENLALMFKILESTATHTYTGTLISDGTPTWTVGIHDFNVETASLPPFHKLGDEVEVTFGVQTGVNVATSVVVLNSGEGNSYTYEGELTDFTDSSWTVGDYTFLLDGVSLPPYFGKGDVVMVTFKIVNGEMVAIGIEVTETYVAPKVESARCENRLKDHPAILKLAANVGESDPAVILALFCKGFGLGEIKLAYKHAQGSEYSPAMLLALRSSGLGWGEVKKIAAGKPYVDDGDDTDEPKFETKVKPEKPEKAGKPETNNKPEKPGKPEKPDKQDKDNKTNNGKAKGKNK